MDGCGFCIAWIHVTALMEHCWCKWSLWCWTLVPLFPFIDPWLWMALIGCVQVFEGHQEQVSTRDTCLQCDDQHLYFDSVAPGEISSHRGWVEGQTEEMAKPIPNFLPCENSGCRLISPLPWYNSAFWGYWHQKAESTTQSVSEAFLWHQRVKEIDTKNWSPPEFVLVCWSSKRAHTFCPQWTAARHLHLCIRWITHQSVNCLRLLLPHQARNTMCRRGGSRGQQRDLWSGRGLWCQDWR